MKKLVIICLLALFVVSLLPQASCVIDTSNYDGIMDNLTEIRQEYDAARLRYDFETAITYKKQIERYEKKLQDTKLRAQAKYSLVRFPISEAYSVLDQMSGKYPQTLITQLDGQIEQFKDRLDELDNVYFAGDYNSTLEGLDSLVEDSAKLPQTVISSAIDAIGDLKKDLDAKSHLTPSSNAMLDDSTALLKEARTKYYDFEKAINSGKLDSAKAISAEAKVKTEEAFQLIGSSKEDPGMLNEIKLILIIGPIVLILILLIYFKFSFRRMVISSTLIEKKTTERENVLVERKISVKNPESSIVFMTVVDFPSDNATLSNFSIGPSNSKNGVVWEFELGPKERKVITYQLAFPKIHGKKNFAFAAPNATYLLDGKQKKFVGKKNKIKI